MAKKFLLVVLALIIAGGAFAQTDTDSAEAEVKTETAMAKNTVVVDIGPTIIGAVIGAAGGMLGGDESLSSSGFGIAAQYERQITEKFSVAGRFAYLGGGVGAEDSYTEKDPVTGATATVKTGLGIDMSSYSIEGHARFYPSGRIFFLDGMLGFANMSVAFSGSMKGTVEVAGQKEEQKVDANVDASQGFIKMGAKIGWRISPRKGGFTFEPSFGYSYGIGFGDTIGQQLSSQIKKKTGADIDEKSFDDIFDIIEDFIFIGGPRLTLAFGWRF